jgi:hypothetical protein
MMKPLASLPGLLAVLLVAAPSAAQETVVPFVPGDRLSPTVSVNVTFNAQTGLFVYSYTVANASTSEQAVENFYLELSSRAELRNVAVPSGWVFGRFKDRPIVGWSVVDGGTPFPADSPFFGEVPPSPFHIQPGQTVTGFSFQSRFPPQSVRFFVEGYRLQPQRLSEDSVVPDFTESSVQGMVQGPGGTTSCTAQGGDADGDGICDPMDRCTFTPDPQQADSGGLATSGDPMGSQPDGIGDACQCGDVNKDGRVNPIDVDLIREMLLGNATLPAPTKCSVAGPASGFPGDCDVDDVADLRLAFLQATRDPALRQSCSATNE